MLSRLGIPQRRSKYPKGKLVSPREAMLLKQNRATYKPNNVCVIDDESIYLELLEKEKRDSN